MTPTIQISVNTYNKPMQVSVSIGAGHRGQFEGQRFITSENIPQCPKMVWVQSVSLT
jgi:hypothetical protein